MDEPRPPSPSPEEVDATTIAAWMALRSQPPRAVVALAGDLSQRRYFRVELARGTVVVAWYPKSMADRLEAFLTSTRLLQSVGVRVPRILDCDAAARTVVLEDIGSTSLFDLPEGSAETVACYRRALEFATRISRLDHDDVDAVSPRLDLELMRRELDQTWQRFLEADLATRPELRDLLREQLDALCVRLAAAPLAPCHRDLMARNLHVTGAGELVLIDHQDLRLGPCGYDVASLLNDSSRLHEDQRVGLEEIAELGAPGHYSRLCVQRTLKIVGTFHAFAARGNPRHLGLVAPALATAARHLSQLPEAGDLGAALGEHWRRGS